MAELLSRSAKGRSALAPFHVIAPSLCPIIGGGQSIDPSLSSSRGSEAVAALDGKRHSVKISPVGVEVLEVDE